MDIDSLMDIAYNCVNEALQGYKNMISGAAAGSRSKQQASAVLKQEASLIFATESVITNLKRLQSIRSVLQILNAVADQGIDDQVDPLDETREDE